MDRLASEIARFDSSLPVAAAWMPPAAWYTDPAVAELERRAVFSGWQPVAHAGDLPGPGAWRGGCHGDLPWLIVRDEAGELRALHNTCRHKAAILAEGAGAGEELVCPYHAWRYGLDGRLRRAPKIGGILDFDREALSLPAMGLATWGPLVLVHPRPDAPHPRDLHPELDALLAQSGWDRLRYAGGSRYDIACNWKVFVDNYLDGGYHIAHVHPTLDAQLAMEGYRTEVFARSSLQSAPGAAAPDERVDFDIAARMGDRALYGWIYPNLMINRYGPGMDTNLVLPRGPDRCEVIFAFFFPEGTDPAFIARSMAQADLTQREDVAISESVQRGLRSPAYDRGRYAPALEVGEHHFHQLLATDLRQALGER